MAANPSATGKATAHGWWQASHQTANVSAVHCQLGLERIQTHPLRFGPSNCNSLNSPWSVLAARRHSSAQHKRLNNRHLARLHQIRGYIKFEASTMTLQGKVVFLVSGCC